MPVTQTEISKYSVELFSPGVLDGAIARVGLYAANGSVAASYRFYSSAVTPPPNDFRVDLGHAIVNCPGTMLQSMIDVLRNEKPLYFVWYDYPSYRVGGVTTSRESIGETEPA